MMHPGYDAPSEHTQMELMLGLTVMPMQPPACRTIHGTNNGLSVHSLQNVSGTVMTRALENPPFPSFPFLH